MARRYFLFAEYNTNNPARAKANPIPPRKILTTSTHHTRINVMPTINKGIPAIA